MAYNATEHHEQVMYDFLKEGAALETNEQDSLLEENSDQSDEENGVTFHSPDPCAFDAYEKYIAGRQTLLDDLFSNKNEAAKAEQAVISANLTQRDYESSAPLLDDPVKEAEAVRFDAVHDFVVGLLDE